MTIRNDRSIELNLPSIDNISERAELRKFMLNKFIQEDCETKLRYFVELLSDGNRIYIERPGRLNKGCDFVIFAEGLPCFNNGNDKPPKHDDLFSDLHTKKSVLKKQEYNLLLQSIKDIYNLNTYQSAISHVVNFSQVGWSYELVLKLARWFFIEQDITYWAKSGRQMLYNGIMDTK